MQKLGWISRAVDAQDNRLTNATLTPAGQAVVNEALPKRAAFFDESLKGLSANDVETLNRVLSVLEENFGTEDYGVGVRKDDTELLGKLDKTLDSMKQDGTAGRIATQWFGANIIK
ncbi:hypothetical protein G6F59_017516 [Rhizopus arrhizus]|nr:hypothetical protein G6F59_017516 [Rhizopus arrhizus]